MNQFLFSPTKQFVYPSGKILVGGKIYVFIKHTNTLATLYNDEGVEIANPVVLDSNGRATVLANEDYDYKLDVYTSDDELLFTAASYMTDQYERDLAIISTDGSVSITPSISGYTDVWDLSVSGKLDTTAFENFYTNTYGPTISNIHQRIHYVSGVVDDKLDTTAFNTYKSHVDGTLNVISSNTAAISHNTAMLDDKILQNTNNINSVSGGLNTLYNIVIPEIRTDIIDVSSKLDTVSAKVANKLDSTAFDDFISNSYSPNMSTIFSDIGSLKSNKFDSSAFNAFINDSYGPNMSTIYQGLGNLSANKENKITWAYNNDGEISAANGSALAGKGYYSKYTPYMAQATSGNLILEGSRYPRYTMIGVSGENGVTTAGIVPTVPEQNLTATRILVAASGSLADVGWQEFDLSVATAIEDKLDWSAFTAWSAGPYLETSYAIKGGLSSLSAYVNDCCSSLPETYVPYSATTITTASTAQLVDTETVETMIISATSAIDTFSGVTTDSTLTGDGKNDPLGVADIQTLSSDSTINITSSNDAVILGVNMLMINSIAAQTSAAAVASAQSGLIRDIDFQMQNVGIFGDSMSGYNADGTVWIRNHWTVERAEASGDELNNYLDTEYNTNYISIAPSAKEVFDAVRTNSASWSQGTTYSSVSGTVIVSGNDLEISSPAIRTGVPWEVGGWSHSYDDSTAFNAGFQKVYNTYRVEHIMSSRQYPNPAHTGFSAELRQIDENYNILSSTMLYGIFDFEFTPVPNCDMIWLYCSGTSAECQRGVTDYYRTGNNTKWVENLAWENDTPTRNEFANLYENIAVNSGSWSEGTSIDFHYIEV